MVTVIAKRKITSTHAANMAVWLLLSDALPQVAKPALVLTPPDIATEADDGLLTASEIAQLKLNAEWLDCPSSYKLEQLAA
jgi:hypothetical protein